MPSSVLALARRGLKDWNRFMRQILRQKTSDVHGVRLVDTTAECEHLLKQGGLIEATSLLCTHAHNEDKYVLVVCWNTSDRIKEMFEMIYGHGDFLALLYWNGNYYKVVAGDELLIKRQLEVNVSSVIECLMCGEQDSLCFTCQQPPVNLIELLPCKHCFVSCCSLCWARSNEGCPVCDKPDARLKSPPA